MTDNSDELPVKISQRQMRQIANMAAEMAVDLVEERMRLKQIWLTEKEAAEVLAMSEKSLKQMRYTGDGPAFVRVSEGPKSPVRYPREELHMWARLRPRRRATRDENELDVFDADQMA